MVEERGRIQVYSDSPTAPTGFGTVSRNLFVPLCEEFALNFTGVNYYGDPHSFPFPIWPAAIAGPDPDLYGRARFVARCLGQAPHEQPDVMFFLQDHFTLSHVMQFPEGVYDRFVPGLIRRLREQVARGERRPFRVVQYLPIDGETLRPEWVDWIREQVDVIVCYTEFGRRVLLDVLPDLDERARVIPHGTSPHVFFPVSDEVRRDYRARLFGLGDLDPLVINVNRNQPRKDIPRTLQVFQRVLREMPNAKLYLHMAVRDSMGFSLDRVAHDLRLPRSALVFPKDFSEGHGVPLEHLNILYNLGDVFLTTARGGGWELPVTEAMCAGTPVVAPDHTSHHEILADGRGVLVPCREKAWIVMDNDQGRPVADLDGMAAAVLELLRDGKRREEISAKARQWACGLEWEAAVVPQWREVFQSCVDSLRERVSKRRALNG